MKKIIIFSFTVVSLSSCYKENFRERHPATFANILCDTTAVMSYSTNIKPILDNSCTSNCHNGAGPGHSLSAWASVKSDALSGSLYGSVAWLPGYQIMPQGATSKIALCDITKIKKWVDAGAPNN